MTARLSTTARAITAITAAGLAGVALSACTPNEQPSTVPGTVPPVISGQQASPTVDADGIPNGGESHGDNAAPGEAVGTATLTDAAGAGVGAATFVAAGNQAKVNLRVTGLTAGQHKVEIRSGGSCDATNGYSATGNVLAGGSLPGIAVAADGTGTATQAVSVKIADLNAKTLVVIDANGGAPVACGVIAAS